MEGNKGDTMNVKVMYQGLEGSAWIDQFIAMKISKLDRFLANASSVKVSVKYLNDAYVTSLAIHNPHKDYAFTAEGLNVFDSLSGAMDKATRSLGEHKRKIKDKINRKFYSMKKNYVELP